MCVHTSSATPFLYIFIYVYSDSDPSRHRTIRCSAPNCRRRRCTYWITFPLPENVFDSTTACYFSIKRARPSYRPFPSTTSMPADRKRHELAAFVFQGLLVVSHVYTLSLAIALSTPPTRGARKRFDVLSELPLSVIRNSFVVHT